MEQFDKYWGNFKTKDKEVRSNLAELSALLKRYDVPDELVLAAAKSHLDLGEAYSSAIKNFDRSNLVAYRERCIGS